MEQKRQDVCQKNTCIMQGIERLKLTHPLFLCHIVFCLLKISKVVEYLEITNETAGRISH